MDNQWSCEACITYLQNVYVRCYSEELTKKIRHKIHENCKACYRGKMLKLRPGKNHNCDIYHKNLMLAYKKYGLECMKSMAEDEWGIRTIGFRFTERLQEDHPFLPEEHNHAPGMNNWTPMSYYYKNFWKIEHLVEKLEADIGYWSHFFRVDDKCDLCYNERKFLTRIYYDYKIVNPKKA